MLTKCQSCVMEAEWRERYILREKQFNRAIKTAEIITLFAVVIAFACLIITIFYGIHVIKFIESFEAVEETVLEIEQTDGINTAFIGGESEVKIYGPDNQNN